MLLNTVELVLDSLYLPNPFSPFPTQVSVLSAASRSRPPTYRGAQAGLDKGALSVAIVVAFTAEAGETYTPPSPAIGRLAGPNDRSRGKALLVGDSDVSDDDDDGEVHVVAGDSTRRPRSVSVAARELVDVA